MATDYLAEDTARGASDVPQQAPAFARLRSATGASSTGSGSCGGCHALVVTNTCCALPLISADSTIRMLLAGGVAGCVSKTVTAPLARLTILYQVCLVCNTRRDTRTCEKPSAAGVG